MCTIVLDFLEKEIACSRCRFTLVYLAERNVFVRVLNRIITHLNVGGYDIIYSRVYET